MMTSYSLRRTLYRLVLLISLLVLGSGLLLSPLSARAGNGDGKSTREHNPKIDSALEQVLTMAASGMSLSAMDLANNTGVRAQGNSVTAVLELAPSFRGPLARVIVAAVDQLAPGLVVASTERFVKVRLPLNPAVLTIVDAILQLTGVAYVRPPAVPQALTISEGVALTGAADLQTAGYRGQGVKIAVIDLGFSGLATAQARGELPTNVHKQDYTGTGLESGTAHGTAVAEIIHDMAPDAELYLMKVGDEVDLERAVDDAIRYGVDIINHSVGWFNTNFYDGTGAVDEIAAKARSHGILWVNAAGNYAQRHWSGTFRDGNRNGWCEFSGSDEDLNIYARGGELIGLYLTWDEWPHARTDYDLYLFDSRGRQVAISDRLQTGTEEPTEVINYRVPTTGTYHVKIKLYRGSGSPRLALFSLNHDLEHAVPRGSIIAPADSSAVVAVGAIGYRNWSSGPAEPYSSQGPTSDGRSKPDISAPDQVLTSTLGRFPGTSAATPHVAGAAALLLSETPGLSAAQLEAKLKSSAIPMGSTLIYGAGRLSLRPQVVQQPDLVISNVSYTPRQPRVGDQLVFTVQVKNNGNGTAGSFTVELRDGLGSDRQTVNSLAPGATAQLSFTRRIDSTSVTYTFTADALNQITESNENNNIYRITVTASQPAPTNRPPVARFTFTPDSPTVGQAVAFDASSSYDPDGRIVNYAWDLNGDGRVDAHGVRVSYSYSQARSYRISLTVTDNGGLSSTTAQQLTVQAAPAPSRISIRVWADKQSYQLNERFEVTFEVRPRSYVYVYYVSAAGVVTQLFPNRFSSQNYLEGRHTLPDGNYYFMTTDPAGTAHVHAIAIAQPIPLGLQGRQDPAWTDPQSFQAEIARQIGGSATWSGAWTELEIGTPQPSPPPPTNRAPVAHFTFAPDAPTVGQVVSFDASGSYDPDGQIVNYAWDFDNDGRIDAHGVRVTHVYTQARRYRVALTVTDNGGLSSTAARWITVGPATQPPPPAPPPSTGLPTVTLGIDRGCNGRYQPGDPVVITYSVSETAQFKLYDFSTSGQMTLLAQGTLAGGQRGRLMGRVVGPAGIETVVLFARTASGMVATAACSFTIGSPGGTISLSIDRGPGGQYRAGDPISFSYTISEDATVVLYDFEPTGTLKRISLGWLSGGQPHGFTGRIVGPPGVETAVLIAYTRSGKVLTAAVSWQVLP